MPVQLIGLQVGPTMWEYRVKDGGDPIPFLVYSSEYPNQTGSDAVVRWCWWYDKRWHGYAEHMTKDAAVAALRRELEKRGWANET